MCIAFVNLVNFVELFHRGLEALRYNTLLLVGFPMLVNIWQVNDLCTGKIHFERNRITSQSWERLGAVENLQDSSDEEVYANQATSMLLKAIGPSQASKADPDSSTKRTKTAVGRRKNQKTGIVVLEKKVCLVI